MQFYTGLDSIDAMSGEIATFVEAHGDRLPDCAATPLKHLQTHSSVVHRIVNTAETLYANLGRITDEETLAASRTLVAQCANFAASNKWHSYERGRGRGMLHAMMRDLGKEFPGIVWPTKENDPIMDRRFIHRRPA